MEATDRPVIDAFDDSAAAVAQARIEALPYPPTMRYDVRTLGPKGCLLDRCRTILRLCPDFFRANAWLDVGANKGFFSLRAAVEGSRRVVAIDPDASMLDAWEPVRPHTVETHCTTFGGFDPKGERFDLVWIGNGPHYLYREDQQYLQRVIEMASDRLVMEGPVGRRCRDVRDWDHVQEQDDMLEVLTRGYRPPFSLIGRADSPTYTPARAIWFLRRRSHAGAR